jgi:hypothetical protein
VFVRTSFLKLYLSVPDNFISALLRLLVGCHGDRDVGLGFESSEHEILSQVLTGLARARGFLIDEVSGPRTFF